VISSKKKFLKKVLKGILIAIIVYITVSLVSTKIIYDAVFKRYSAEVPHSVLKQSEQMVAQRQVFSYPCDGRTLVGHLYSAGGKNGLIVLAPGFHAESIEYEGVIYAFLQEGFDVFAFNPTGCGQSGGDNYVGFPQMITDVDATLDIVAEQFSYTDVFLFGHSHGAYGVCCAIAEHPEVRAVVAVNGVDRAMDAIMAYSTKYVGELAYGNYPFLNLYQNMIFGQELSESSAIDALNASGTPALIVQSAADEQIKSERFSIYAHRDKLTSEHVCVLLYNKPGCDGHTTILQDESRQPNMDIIRIISDFYKQQMHNKELKYGKNSRNPGI